MLYTNNKHKLMDFKISCLLFIRNQENKLLLLKRKKTPNKGLWSPPGGKLLTEIGESPVECAKREAGEETGLHLSDNDLSLFGYVSEKAYESTTHWLMFLFDCNKTLSELPCEIDEGHFEFYSRQEIDGLEIPKTDNQLVWPFYDKKELGFWGLRADCSGSTPKIKIEASPS